MRLLILLTTLFLIPMLLQGQNGSLEYNGEQEILNVWGTNSEMAYAQGYLLNQRITDFAVDFLFNGMGISPAEYQYIYSQYWIYFEVPSGFREEAHALLTGIVDGGGSIFIDSLGRNMDSTDVLIANSLGDLAYLFIIEGIFNCSSLSSWGDATMQDTLLNGDIVMGRNLDFSHTDLMLKEALIMTFDPDNGKEWLGFGYPGIISCISGMNEGMLAVEMNMGYHTATPSINPKLQPFQFTQRAMLELPDYNGNDTIDFWDAFERCKDTPNAGSWLCHTVVPYLDSATIAAAVLECVNESGDTFRTAMADTNLRPWNLLLLNHEEVNYTPPYDPRYGVVVDSIRTNPDVTTGRMWNIMRAVSWQNTIQTMMFLPNDSMIAISFADSAHNAAQKTPYWYHWTDLFPNHGTGIKEEKEKRPGNLLLYAQFINAIQDRNLIVYTITGRKLNPSDIASISSGVFFIKRAHTKNTQKLLVIR
jgi:hypothetical protein